jgi:hypothetical protein
VVTVTQCKPFSKSNSDYVFGQNHLVILLDPATGSTSFMPRRNLFNPPKNFQLPQFFYDEFNSSRLHSNNDEGKRFTTHARLLILVPDFITSQSFQWSHSVSNREETPKRVNTGKRFTAKQSPDAWLAVNPIPSSNASYAEREAWVSKLIDYSHANPLVANLRQDSPLMLACINNIEHIAKAQHEGRLPEGFIMHDIVKYYDRDFLKKYPNIAHSSEVIWYWQRKGWTVDLIDIARDALRAGKGGAFSGIILAEPQLMNLSREEWIDYFSLNCNGVTYQKMKDRILPAEILNQIADQFLLYRNDVDLGLARGHADAPRWMKRSALTPNSFYIYHLGEQLTNHFELPAPIPPYIIDHRLKKEPIIQWLEKFDPDAYVYDSAKQKYILKPTP